MTDRTVVVVDRNESQLSQVSALLQQHGLEVVMFRNFESARQYLQINVPLALVTDIQLGQFNGLHLVLLAHQWSPSTAAFVYSADDGNNATRQEANVCGAIYVQKDDISSILVPKLLETLTQPNMA